MVRGRARRHRRRGAGTARGLIALFLVADVVAALFGYGAGQLVLSALS